MIPRGTRYAICMTCDAKTPTFAFDDWTDPAADAAITAWLDEHGWLELPKGERRRSPVNVCRECAGEIEQRERLRAFALECAAISTEVHMPEGGR